MKKFNIFYFLMFFAWASVTTLASVYMNEVVGLSLSNIGLMMSVLPLISVFFQPIWGGVADVTGKRRGVLQGLMLAAALVTFAITMFTKSYIVVGFYFMYQVFLCGQGPLTDSIAIQIAEDTPKASFGFIRIWGSIGYAVGAIIVAFIANQMGLRWSFYTASLAFFIGFVLTRGIKETRIVTAKSHFKADLKTLLKEKKYLFILIYSFLLVGGVFSSDQYLGLFIRSVDIDVSMIGVLTFISVCFEVPFMFYSKRLIEKLNPYKLLLLMNIIAVARMFILSISSSIPFFLLAGILRGIIVGIFIPLFIELICEITPKAVVTSAVAIYTAVSSGIANFIFTLTGGILAEQLGYQTLYLSYGLMMLIPLVMAAFMMRTAKE